MEGLARGETLNNSDRGLLGIDERFQVQTGGTENGISGMMDKKGM